MANEEAKIAMLSAEKVVGTLKKLGEIGEISQKEMQNQAMDSIVKKKPGKYRLTYKKNKRTIVAEPRGWEWEPRSKDICFDKVGHELIVIGINRRKPWIIEVTEVFEDEINLDSYTICPDEVIPYIPWEKLEKIMNRFGYELHLRAKEYNLDGVGVAFSFFRENKKWIVGKDRQTAVTLALFELEKELK